MEMRWLSIPTAFRSGCTDLNPDFLHHPFTLRSEGLKKESILVRETDLSSKHKVGSNTISDFKKCEYERIGHSQQPYQRADGILRALFASEFGTQLPDTSPYLPMADQFIISSIGNCSLLPPPEVVQ
jgi:hypothetical protein